MSSYVEGLLVVLLILVIIGGIFLGGAWGYVGLAVDGAAYNCARMGASTLDPTRGMIQAIWSARATLANYHLDPSGARIQVWGSWERNGKVFCRVSYSINLRALPFASLAGNSITVRGAAAAGVAGWRSLWR